ncbi:MAG: hypothetical protein SVP26_08070 [Chloroflexota bacterium]|nr:hypothetical protein [Chloroflexota bacterium]
MRKLTLLWRRAKRVYETEGPVHLMRRVLSFAASRFFVYQRWYLAENHYERTPHLNEARPTPGVDVTFRVVTGSQMARELEKDGLEFRSYPHFVNADKALDAGAAAICVFAGRELAAISWIALSQEAKDTFGDPPVEVDFSDHEGWTGGVWTNPKYRRMGLGAYRFSKMRQFFLDRDIGISRACVEKRNVAALSGSAKVGDVTYAEGRYLRVLWWRSWRETPLTPEGHGRTGEHGA